MASYKDLEAELRLGAGESAIVTVDPRHEVGKEQGQYGMQWYFPVTLENGTLASIKGGKRLRDAFVRAGVRTFSGPTRVKITAIGEPRTLQRDYRIEIESPRGVP